MTARAALALLVAAAGAIHLYLWFDFFHRVHVVGVLFLVNTVTAAVVAAALLVGRSPLALLAAAGFSLGTLAGFAVSTQWGLFGYHERLWGSWQEAAGGVEIAAALLAASIPLSRARARRPAGAGAGRA
jgi:hypothetical protein